MSVMESVNIYEEGVSIFLVLVERPRQNTCLVHAILISLSMDTQGESPRVSEN